MSLTLFALPHSPYCIHIKRILDAFGVEYHTVDVPNWDRRAVIEASGGAYYQVPMLLHDGAAIYESQADSNDIARYLDAKWAGGRLFPRSLEGLQDIIISYLDDEVEAATFRACDVHYLDSITDPVGRVMVLRHKERKFGRGCVDEWKRNLEALRQDAGLHFRRFDAMLQQHPFLFGDKPVYADFLLFGIVSNYTWNGWNQLPDDVSALKKWNDVIRTWKHA